MNRFFAIASIAIPSLVAASIIGGSFYTIDSGYIGVLSRNGAVTGTAEPGLSFKLPFIDSVREISLKQQLRAYDGGGTGLNVYTFDQQAANVFLSVNWRIPADPESVKKVFISYGSEEALASTALDQKVYELVKNVFGTFNAAVAIKERTRLNAEIENAVKKTLAGIPIIIESVQISNIDYSDAYEKVAEERSQAEVEVLKQKQLLEKEKIEAEITVTKAKAEADSNLARAEALAKGTRLAGEAEASAIRAKGAALKDNPELVNLIQAEKWNGTLPTTMVPGSTVPFINVK